MRARLFLASAVGLGLFGLAGPAAIAQEIDSEATESISGAPSVAAVDATGDLVEIAVLGASALDADDLSVVEDGRAVEDTSVVSAVESGRGIEILYVLDVDTRMAVDGRLTRLIAEIERSVDQMPADTKVGLVTAGEQANIESRPGTDRDRLATVLRGLPSGQGSALYDAVALAGLSFDRSDDSANRPFRSVVVVSGGPDSGSQRSVGEVQTALTRSGAQLVWLGLGNSDPAPDRLVSAVGGITVVAADRAEARGVGLASELASDRLLISYRSTSEPGTRSQVVLGLGDDQRMFSFPHGLVTTAPAQLAALPEIRQIEPGLFGQPMALYISVGLAFLAIAGGLWSLVSIFADGEASLDQRLARYSRGGASEELDDDELKDLLVHNALMQRAVDMTENFAERQGFLSRIEELLERANIPVRAGEAVFFLSAVVLVVTAVIIAASGNLIAGVVAAAITALIGVTVVRGLADRRLKQFEAQLPDALQLLAGTLRAGYSLPQGLDAVATEVADPLAQELGRAMTEAQLGREIEDALAAVANRLRSEDFAWVVMAIGIQREVGGNLAEVLLTVSETMVQRERLQREVKALTAEGRVSAGILSLLPPGLGAVMWVLNPAYISVLFTRTIGLILLGLAVVAATAGLFWMKKVITINV